MKYEIPGIRPSDTIKKYEICTDGRRQFVKVYYLDGTIATHSAADIVAIEDIQLKQAREYVARSYAKEVGTERRMGEIDFSTKQLQNEVKAIHGLMFGTAAVGILATGIAHLCKAHNVAAACIVAGTLCEAPLVLTKASRENEIAALKRKKQDLMKYKLFLDRRYDFEHAYPDIKYGEGRLEGIVCEDEHIGINDLDEFSYDDLTDILDEIKRYRSIHRNVPRTRAEQLDEHDPVTLHKTLGSAPKRV